MPVAEVSLMSFGRAKPPSASAPPPEPPPPAANNRRVEPRRRVLLSARLVHSPSENALECALLDISRTGARVRVSDSVAIGDPIWLIDMRHGLAFKSHIAWRRQDRLGLRFTRYVDLSAPEPDAPTILRRLWIERER